MDALRSWVERLARYAVTKHGLADALRKATTPGSDLSSSDTYGAIVAALDRLLQANISAGTLRPGLDADDVILALAGLWQLDPASDWRAQARAHLRHRPQRPAAVQVSPERARSCLPAANSPKSPEAPDLGHDPSRMIESGMIEACSAVPVKSPERNVYFAVCGVA